MKYLHPFYESFCRAIDYYKAIDRRLAASFVKEVESALKQIIKFPKIGRAFPKYRVLLLKNFPYSVCYYQNSEGELYGLVLFHHKQKEPDLN
jgi:plasmid stabilization system protein ParE